MKKTFLIPIIMFLVVVGAAADWKSDLTKYFTAIPNYDSAARFLQELFPSSPLPDRPSITILLAYIYHKLQNPISETHWEKQFFENHYQSKIDVDFLSEIYVVDIHDYFIQASANYPQTTGFALQKSIFPYSEKPKSLLIVFNSSNPGNLKLYRGDRIVAEGPMSKGENLIEFVLPNNIQNTKFDDLILEIISSSIIVKKNIAIEQALNLPDDMKIENGILAYKEKPFKQESKTITEILQTRYFDKKNFLRKVVPDFSVAASLYVVDQLVFHKKVTDDSYSHSSEPLYYALDKSFNFLSISFSAKGIFDLIGCFKTKTESSNVIQTDSEAVEFNKFLSKSISKAAAALKYTYSIKTKAIL